MSKSCRYQTVAEYDIEFPRTNEEKWMAFPCEDKMGMDVRSGTVKLTKDDKNLIGVSIGGGAPSCPCVYIVQLFDNTPARNDGSLEAGDEIVGVNGKSVKGCSKGEVARLIQAAPKDVLIQYNKLEADVKQGKSFDIVMKKVKHRMVENMHSSTADALGLSRAILCNGSTGFDRNEIPVTDSMIKHLKRMETTSEEFRQLSKHCRMLLCDLYELSQVHKNFGEIFSEIGVKEPQPEASQAFGSFGRSHRELERHAVKMLRQTAPVVSDLNTFLNKAIPDTKLTFKKYLDVKFEYLSYCLKVKEMDDEEGSHAALHEPLYRIETGNYEYRLILRLRQLARKRFAKMRNDVLVKLELLDQKHVLDIVRQLQRFVDGMNTYHQCCLASMKDTHIFPIEIDMARESFSKTIDDIKGIIHDIDVSANYSDEPASSNSHLNSIRQENGISDLESDENSNHCDDDDDENLIDIGLN